MGIRSSSIAPGFPQMNSIMKLMRYWRHYPRFLQVILLMLMIFTFASFATVIVYATLMPLFGVRMDQLTSLGLNSPKPIIHAAQYLQGLVSLFTYGLSALAFAYLTHPAPSGYLGLRKPGRSIQLPLALICFLFFIPLVNQLGTWIQQIDLGAGARANLEQNEQLTHALLQGTTPSDLTIHLLLVALLPAVVEELLFRGIVMRFSYSNTRSVPMAILFSAAIFALAHRSVYNFVPIMLMGVLLGYLYYATGSLLPSMLAHFLNNALGVLGVYASNTKMLDSKITSTEDFPWYVLAIALVLFLAGISLFRKVATPLPADWSDDFRGERIQPSNE